MVPPESKYRRRGPNKARALLITLVIAAAVLSTIGLASIIGSPRPPRQRLPPATSAASMIVKDPFAHPDAQERISHFKETAKSFDPMSDKIGNTSEHRYHNMYGQFLLPFAANKPHFKFLEIGLGCNMNYGPGASVVLWKTFFPQAELWEAEYVKECVDKAVKNKQVEGINLLVGDQADYNVLDSWIEKSGGEFDIIIDDGGHHNCQISNSFDKLWPQLNPGGYYFIEDLHVGLASSYISKDCGNVVMSEKLKQWQQQLIYRTNTFGQKWDHRLPKDMMFVHCQAEACVLGKRKNEVNDPHNSSPRGKK